VRRRDLAELLQAGFAALLAIAAIVVFLVTSAGCAAAPPPPAPPRPVPAMVGQPRLEAEQALSRAGLRPTYTYRYAEVDLDWVVEQRPEAGTMLSAAAPVEVVVATRHPR
jgi:beta-lactam-binding protein with PASTA domain